MGKKDTEKAVLVTMSADLENQIKNYQFENRISSKNEAIRQLIRKGLEK